MVDTSLRGNTGLPAMEPGQPGDYMKLLSHRGRGFGYAEATRDAVRAALRSGINYVEFDTRIAADGVIHARHGTRIYTHLAMPKVRTLPDAVLAAHGVETLSEVLGAVASTIHQSQHICIDIKDFGFEREHVELVERFGLGEQTIFVSWIPQALAQIHAIAPKYKLILSYLNLRFLPFGAKLIEAILGDREIQMLDYVLLGPRAIDRPLRHTTGFQHALVGRGLSEDYIRLLVSTGGGICVPTWCVCDDLDAWCTRRSLQQWVYSANDADSYEKLRLRPAVQVIFSDDPLRVAGQAAPEIV